MTSRTDTAELEDAYHTLVLERIDLAVRHGERADELQEMLSNGKLEIAAEFGGRTLVAYLRCHLWGKERARVKVDHRCPATWWDAFRERWAPQWWKRRHPVRWAVITIDQPLYDIYYLNSSVPEGRTRFEVDLHGCQFNKEPDGGG